MSYTAHRSLFTRPVRLLFALALALAPILGLAPAPAQAASGGCVTNAGTVTCTFKYTGAAETWTVPHGVRRATFDLYGAGAVYSGYGGKGGRVRATLDVAPGATYQILVGAGNGFNGGGLGGHSNSGEPGGSPGGGASDVRLSPYTLAERLLVAGGGGGTRGNRGLGGDGGYPAGTSGGGGAGGSQTAGGGGASGAGAGSLGQGGAGEDASGYESYGGGGGGGGYYGGGGGGACEDLGDGCSLNGGGGGSSYATPAATNVSFETGVRSDGAGQVIISYDLESVPPTASPSQSPAANPNGWSNSDVTVDWNWADNDGSGIDPANCTGASTSSGEGEQTLSASCADLAGNQGSASYTVKVDKTAPSVSVTGVTDGASYPLGSVPAAGCSTSDALSGVATAATLGISGGNADGSGSFTATCSGATDLAGNTGSASVSYTVKAAAFPSTAVLDSFDRANGKVGGSWEGLTATSFYKLISKRLDVQLGGPLVWKPASFGASQEAFVTLSKIDSTSPSTGVLLKVQADGSPNAGAISVVYDARARAVRVSTLRLGQNDAWTPYANQPVTFASGDVLGAQAKADGTVLIYKNGTLVATVTLTTADQSFFNDKGGKIGIWTAAAPKALLDDFGGGTLP